MINKINEADYLAGVNEANYQQLLTMYQAMQKERDKLKAQVEQLRKPLSTLVKTCHDRGGALEEDGQFAYKVKAFVFKSAKNALDATPARCLSEHDAVVGRKAFIAGVNATGQGYNGELGLSDDEIIDLAELYVSRKIRQQAKGE